MDKYVGVVVGNLPGGIIVINNPPAPLVPIKIAGVSRQFLNIFSIFFLFLSIGFNLHKGHVKTQHNYFQYIFTHSMLNAKSFFQRICFKKSALVVMSGFAFISFFIFILLYSKPWWCVTTIKQFSFLTMNFKSALFFDFIRNLERERKKIQ